MVLPTRDGARYLDESVASVVAQDLQDWELILVDDASTDRTPELIAAWCAKDPRIRALRLDPNRRTPAALNAGFERARAPLFTWTSDDNRHRPSALRRLSDALLAAPDVDVIYSGESVVRADGALILARRAETSDHLHLRNVVGASFMYRRTVHERLGGYDEGMFLVEDWDFWMRAKFEHHLRFATLDEDLYEYRVHDAAFTQRHRTAHMKKCTGVLTRTLRDDPRRLVEGLVSFAELAVELGELSVARKHLRAALRASPRDALGRWELIVRAFAGRRALSVARRASALLPSSTSSRR